MNFNIMQICLVLLLATVSTTNLLADQTEDLLKVMNQAMMEPCNSKPYLACLGLQQTFCRKQVGIAVEFCNKKFPVKQVKTNQQQFFQAFGECMQTEIVNRLKLNEAMMVKCEPVLKAGLPKG